MPTLVGTGIVVVLYSPTQFQPRKLKYTRVNSSEIACDKQGCEANYIIRSVTEYDPDHCSSQSHACNFGPDFEESPPSLPLSEATLDSGSDLEKFCDRRFVAPAPHLCFQIFSFHLTDQIMIIVSIYYQVSHKHAKLFLISYALIRLYAFADLHNFSRRHRRL